VNGLCTSDWMYWSWDCWMGRVMNAVGTSGTEAAEMRKGKRLSVRPERADRMGIKVYLSEHITPSAFLLDARTMSDDQLGQTSVEGGREEKGQTEPRVSYAFWI
jgi:hypothetical protein